MWSNLFLSPHASVYYSVGGSALFLLFSGTAYFLLALLGDITNQKNLYPTYRWYNFIQKYRQKRINKKQHLELLKDIENHKEESFPKPAIYQESSTNAKCYVRIRNVCKTFSKHKVALQEISMDIFHEEITVFLGHSGSGKSTIISILAGMVCPTTGYATIKDFDVSFEASKSRKYTGLCPQKLIYFNLLTVTEHVTLCYRLRGYDKQETNRHTATLLIRLKLWPVRKQMPTSLNPDELRRLGMAMALADSPKVLLLDEPTSFMDSMSRREIWGILQELKKNHTIIMSTNFMDEAEYLADKIGLIAHGKLICYGSPKFLKDQYDTGYFMRLQPYEDDNSKDLETQSISEIVTKHLGPEVRNKKNVSVEEMHYQILELPKNQFKKFSSVCEELEARKESLGIRKFSIRQVSLSDIFIKICESIVIEKDAPDLYVRRDSTGDWKSAIMNQLPVIPDDEQYKPQVHDHIWALTKKRILYMKTHNDFFIMQYIFPLILILMVVAQATMYSRPEQSHPPKNISLPTFPRVEVYYRIGQDDPRAGFKNIIRDILKGAGTEIGRNLAMSPELDAAADAKGQDASYMMQSVAVELRRISAASSALGLIGYFSSGSLHSAPLILNILDNIRIRAISVNHSIYAINEPLPGKVGLNTHCGASCVVFGVLVSLGFAFITAGLVIFPLRERKSGVKHLQLMTGVHPVVYWATDYLYDFILMLIITFLVTALFLLDFNRTFATVKILSVLLGISFLYLCWSSIPFCYFISTIMPITSNGFNFMVGIHIFTGVIPIVWIQIVGVQYVGTSVGFFRFISLIFPAYAITSALQNFFDAVKHVNHCRQLPESIAAVCSVEGKRQYYKYIVGGVGRTLDFVSQDARLIQCCDKLCIQEKSCYVPPDIVTLSTENAASINLVIDLIALILQGFFYWGMLIISERKVFPRLMQFIVLRFLKNMEKNVKPEKVSRDIREEKVRVHSLVDEAIFPSDDVLLVKDLTKSYTSTMVISDFTLEVKKGQCVGILGGGGSGKSTIMQMLTGELIPTRGMCYIGRYNLLQHPKQYLSKIGYCPQRNALFDNFTGVQMLELIGRLKGIPKVHLSIHIRKWLQILGLSDAAKDLCKNYGTGMQRRLCAAMALIGGNQIILLDEPTSGVDSISRQRFWAVMHQLRATGHTIVFTSFNTEECSNLASKLIVISEGNVQCVGTPEELIERFSFGHTVIFRLSQDVLSHLELVSATMGRVVELKKVVEQTFKYANLVDEQDSILIYFLRNTRLTWSEIFKKCDGIQAKFSQIVESTIGGTADIWFFSYDVTESLLEDLFILLTNKYREMDNPRRTEPLHPFDVSKVEAELADYKKATKAMQEESLAV